VASTIQFDSDMRAIGGALHAAFHHRLHIQPRPNLAQVVVLPLNTYAERRPATRTPSRWETEAAISSVNPSLKASLKAGALRLSNGRTAIDEIGAGCRFCHRHRKNPANPNTAKTATAAHRRAGEPGFREGVNPIS